MIFMSVSPLYTNTKSRRTTAPCFQGFIIRQASLLLLVLYFAHKHQSNVVHNVVDMAKSIWRLDTTSLFLFIALPSVHCRIRRAIVQCVILGTYHEKLLLKHDIFLFKRILRHWLFQLMPKKQFKLNNQIHQIVITSSASKTM